MVLNTILLILAFWAMEFVAWFSHKYLMHGPLWFLHRDHHIKNRDRFWEWNDAFFIVFATPGIWLIYGGFVAGLENPQFWIGLGISLYGMVYLFVHDIAVHQRLRFLRKPQAAYFKALRKAHKIHHKSLTREEGENFGFVLVSGKYLREARTGKK